MAQSLKHWKNAATLMIAARAIPPASAGAIPPAPPQSPHLGKVINDNLKSADTRDKYGFDYNLLMLKRSSKSAFMPSAYVFPGGKIGESDFSSEWLRLFQEAGLVNVAETLSRPMKQFRPPIFQEDPGESGVNNDLAFRICAIRETFEESGVLICKHPDQLKKPSLDQSPYQIAADKVNHWRDTVHSNELKFLEMCSTFGVVPDVWSICDWSDWLTPTNMAKAHGDRRFDTVFFVCCLPQIIEPIHDDKEIVSSEWTSPVQVLQEFHNQSGWLAPPQIYELSRLCKFDSLMELEDFARQRHLQGCERWMPVRMNCTDGMITVLPGDDLYPKIPDMEGTNPVPDLHMSIDEALKSSKHRHRLELRDQFDCPVRCNVPQKHGHISPMLLDEFWKKFGSCS